MVMHEKLVGACIYIPLAGEPEPTDRISVRAIRSGFRPLLTCHRRALHLTCQNAPYDLRITLRIA